MTRVESFRQYAAECMHQAEVEESPEDKNILLNVALAWVRLAHLKQTLGPFDDSLPGEEPVAAEALPEPVEIEAEAEAEKAPALAH
jgi:hypothetical protein